MRKGGKPPATKIVLDHRKHETPAVGKNQWLTGVMIGVTLAVRCHDEIIDNWLGFRFAKRYGGSTRSGWGALLGGLVGAVIGVPVAIIGSVIGAFLRSFIGAAVFELSYSPHA